MAERVLEPQVGELPAAAGSSPTFLGQGDFYGYASLLSEAEIAVLNRLRTFLKQEAEPVIADYWERGETPVHLREGLAKLDIVDPSELREAGEPVRPLFTGFRNLELSRVDGSLAILFGGQAAMFRTIVQRGATDAQFAAWGPGITSFSMTGCFALTEPDHGSDISRGIQTTARREGDVWILNGAKRWIGNAALSDYAAVIARDEQDGSLKAFLARTDDPGMTITKIGRKTSLRMVNNADIVLENVRVDEAHRLPRINSFRDLNDVFRVLRPDAVWNATGLQLGVYEATLAYVQRREQFGRPLAGFQLVQEKLVRILGNLTASLGMAVRLAQIAEDAACSDEQAALAKTWVCTRMRESASLGRELLGGNGILLDHQVARFHADAESLYTFEGTHEINSLIVGRAITGLAAFT